MAAGLACSCPPSWSLPSFAQETDSPGEANLHFYTHFAQVATSELLLRVQTAHIFNDCTRNFTENEAGVSEGWAFLFGWFGFFLGVS